MAQLFVEQREEWEGMIKFFCESCGEHRAVIIEELQTDNLNPGVAWGDIICQKCHFVIATISTDIANQGKYNMVKEQEQKTISVDGLDLMIRRLAAFSRSR